MKLSKNEKGLEKMRSFQKRNKAIIHKNRKLWISLRFIQSIFFSKRVFYFWHPRNPIQARRASKLWTIVQSGWISMIIVFLLFMLNISMVKSVQWVCGEVNNAEDYTDAAWHDIIIYYENDKTNYASCEVGTEDNKYCCDSEAIPRHRWRIGDIISAEVIDNGDGYIAGPVSVVTTGAGHDVEPKMTLKAIITINSPTNIVYNVNSIILNVTTTNPYNKVIWYSLDNNNNVTLCTNCNYTTTNLTDLSDAQHNIILYVNDSSNNIGKNQVYFTIDTINDQPIIDSYSPINTTLIISNRQSQLFSITKSDPDGTIPSVKWYLDGVEISGETNDNYDYIPEHGRPKSHNITVIVSDGLLTDQQYWNIIINNVPFCGDGICDNGKSCSSCPVDCGTCHSDIKRNITKYIKNKTKYSEILPEKTVIMKIRDSSIKEIISWVKNKKWIEFLI